MGKPSSDELATQAALYALGELHGAERTAFEAALGDPQGVAASTLIQTQRVLEALSWASAKDPPAGLRARLLARARRERQVAPTADEVALAPGIRLVFADQLPWRETGIVGIRYKALFVDHQRRYATRLVEMAAGATYPAHRHTQAEELFMLSGAIEVGGQRLASGGYCRAEAGTVHAAIHAEHGCTFLALASLDDVCLA